MNRIKRWLIAGLLIAFGISSIANISNQLYGLWRAKKEIEGLKKEKEGMEAEISLLKRKLEVATTSAFQERQIRELLGWGSKDDYAVELPEGNLEGVYPKVNIGDEKPIVRQWWELFVY